MDLNLLSNPGYNSTVTTPFVTDFFITIEGASSGNGEFTLPEFGQFIWASFSELDLGKELVGQPTDLGPWGVAFPTSPESVGNEFIFYSNDFAEGTPAPTGIDAFRIATSDGSGDVLALTSFVVPEPQCAILLAMGLGGLLRFRRLAAG